MNKNRVYLDYNATAPLRPEAAKAISDVLAMPHNASAVHSFGREGRKIIEDARGQIAALINNPDAQIIFNSGATEGNNTVIKHFSGQRVLVSSIEHLSVIEPAEEAEHIPATKDGLIDLEYLEKQLSNGDKPALVSVMWVNNETGAIQPIKEVAALAKKYGALFHCDAVQAAGRLPINMQDMGIDFLTLSSHKIGGPQGVGALVCGICGITPSLLTGGDQEKKTRAGTENVAGIAGFGAAAKIAAQNIDQYQNLQKLKDRLEQGLRAVNPGTVIYAENVPRVAGTTFYSVPDTMAETIMMALDLEGVAVSNGSACSSGTVKSSRILEAMGIPLEDASGAIRVSMGWNTKDSDIDRFLVVWSKVHERLTNKKTSEHKICLK